MPGERGKAQERGKAHERSTGKHTLKTGTKDYRHGPQQSTEVIERQRYYVITKHVDSGSAKPAIPMCSTD